MVISSRSSTPSKLPARATPPSASVAPTTSSSTSRRNPPPNSKTPGRYEEWSLQLASKEQKIADENVLRLDEEQKREKEEAYNKILHLEKQLDFSIHIKVLSVTLDEWSSDEIDAMIEVGGNSSANSIYETYFPKGYTKPGLDASHEQRAKFIRLDMFSSNNFTLYIYHS
ncbi:hypothetical protein JHK82_044842 [Glycine max]|nr:hypothetical protein JHK82_044842 [Glycine max]